MTDLKVDPSARESILRSIRSHLAASVPHDVIHAESNDESRSDSELPNHYRPSSSGREAGTTSENSVRSLVEVFRENLQAVGGHCLVVRNEIEVKEAIARVISELHVSGLHARRIALSNAPAIERWVRESDIQVDEIAITPDRRELFKFDVGISTAQAAIAETGTLLLDSEVEKHRLVSLVPRVHIAIVEASDVCLTLAEALSKIDRRELSPTITLITGPSRTGDIELILTIGVHGPQELYVIIKEGSRSS